MPVDRTSPSGAPDRTVHRIDSDGADFGISPANRFNRRFSLELGAKRVDIDNDLSLAVVGFVLADVESAAIESYTLGVDRHLRPEQRVDVGVA